MGALMPHLLKFVLRYRDRVYPERAFSNENQLSELMQERTTSLLPHKHNIPYKKGNILHSKWRNLDDNYLKPFLIYNYEGVKSEMECQRRLSVADIYRVEVNNEGGLDLRNPLPYSIREIDISMRADKNKKKNRRTIGLEGDMNDSLEEEILKGGKSDFDISYDMEGEKKFLDNGSFKIKKSVKYENEMENLSKNLIREKIRNKMLLKGKKKGGNNKSRKIKKNTNQNIEEEE